MALRDEFLDPGRTEADRLEVVEDEESVQKKQKPGHKEVNDEGHGVLFYPIRGRLARVLMLAARTFRS